MSKRDVHNAPEAMIMISKIPIHRQINTGGFIGVAGHVTEKCNGRYNASSLATS
jgi:hypothetical protein